MTIDAQFADIMLERTGCVVVMAGSDSDRPHIEEISKSLQSWQIPHTVRIASAHKQSDRLMEIIREYNSVGGLVGYVAVAGGSDALSGTLSYHALGLVVSCPPDVDADDPNLSSLMSPPGSSNAYIANPKNVGRFFAQAFAHADPRYRALLESKNREKIRGLEKADEHFQQIFSGYKK